MIAKKQNIKNESIKEESVDIPETEKSEPTPESPKIPVVSEAEKSEKDKKHNRKVYQRARQIEEKEWKELWKIVNGDLRCWWD